jgi:DNA-binding transcriptional LysR family regulator
MDRAGLPDLAAFASVATHRSFRRAAAELGVSPSALSHAIRGLEERLGVRLLNRTTRSVAPTAAGERLLLRLGPALRDIGDALDELDEFRDRPAGTLRLNVPRVAARLLIAPAAAAFLRENPGMRLEVATEDGLVDLVAGGFDAGVRFGERVERDMISVRVGPERRFAVVAAPAYLASRGVPLAPADLRGHACVRLRFPSGFLYRWEFEREGESVAVEVDGPLTVDDLDHAVTAAEGGVGIALAFEEQAAAALRAGRLVRVLEDWCPPFPGFHLYYPSRRQVPAGLRAFVELLRREGG